MLLVEYTILDDLKVINEGTSKNPRLKVRGVFQQCDEQNNNGRIYPRGILESQVTAIQDKINERALVGALDHPANDAVHLSQASHLITKLWIEKNGQVMGEAEILSTPNGKIVEALIGDGVKIGISSRGLGSVSEGREGKVVNEDFKLITFDLVSDPSTKGAYPELTESIRENSQRAQAIVSKHRKDRVLLTMLESKIRDRLIKVNEEWDVTGEAREDKANEKLMRAKLAKEAGPSKEATARARAEFELNKKKNPPKPELGRATSRDDAVGQGPVVQDRNSTSLRDFVVNKIKEAFITSQREWGSGSIPDTEANKKVLATKTPTPEDIAKAQERDRKEDAERAANPRTAAQNKRQQKRILNRPRGIEKPEPKP